MNIKCKYPDIHERCKQSGVVHCLICKAKINPTYQERQEALAHAVPKEKQQKLLDNLHKGMTIGEAKKDAGFAEDELGVACEIITRNIGEYHFLRKEAV